MLWLVQNSTVKDFFINQLKKLNGHRQVILESSTAKIACPFHNEGRENTPSLRLNLDNSNGFQPGRSYCFACGKKADWKDFISNELIKPYKLKPISTSHVDINLNIPDLSEEEQFFSKMDNQIKFAPLWDKTVKWRGISGRLLNKIQARELDTEYGTMLYLPAFVNGEFYGGIKCRLNKHKKYPSYINDSGKWSRHTLFPHDYAKYLLSKQKHRVLFLGEGPRDALNPCQFGVPAVCTIGGKTVWNQMKADLILALKPSLVVLAFDPDQIGQELTELAHQDLKHEVKLKRMNFPKGKEKYDPGNTPKKRWLNLKQQLGIV